MAITWRNVDFGGGNHSMNQIAAATVPISMLNDSFTKGLTSLSNTLDKYKEGQINANNEAYQNTLAQYKTPEEFEAAMKAGIFDAARQEHGSWLDGKVARDSVGDYLSKLQQREKEGWAYQNANLQQQASPVIEQMQKMYMSGDYLGAKALAAKHPDLPLSKAMEGMQLWSEDRSKFNQNTQAHKSQMANEALNRDISNFDFTNKKRIESERTLVAEADQHAALGETNAIKIMQAANPNVDFSKALADSRKVTNYDKEVKKAERADREEAKIDSLMQQYQDNSQLMTRKQALEKQIGDDPVMRVLLRDGRLPTAAAIEQSPILKGAMKVASPDQKRMLEEMQVLQENAPSAEQLVSSIIEAARNDPDLDRSKVEGMTTTGMYGDQNIFAKHLENNQADLARGKAQAEEKSAAYWGDKNPGQKAANVAARWKDRGLSSDSQKSVDAWLTSSATKPIVLPDGRVFEQIPELWLDEAIASIQSDNHGWLWDSRVSTNQLNTALLKIAQDPVRQAQYDEMVGIRTADDRLASQNLQAIKDASVYPNSSFMSLPQEALDRIQAKFQKELEASKKPKERYRQILEERR